jgi:hypothetical protein
MKNKRKVEKFLNKLFNNNPPTPFYLAYLQLIREGYSAKQIVNSPKLWNKLINMAVEIRNKINTALGYNKGKGGGKIFRAYQNMMARKRVDK